MGQGEDRRRVATRLGALQVGSCAVFIILALSFWFLQVVQGKRYVELAENNHQRTLALRASRGVLYDREMKVLVENRPSFVVSIDRERTQDMPRTINRAHSAFAQQRLHLILTVEHSIDDRGGISFQYLAINRTETHAVVVFCFAGGAVFHSGRVSLTRSEVHLIRK